MRRTEAVEYSGFCVIQIWELQNDLAAEWPSVSFAHMSGLHAAGMHKIDLPHQFWPRKVHWRFLCKEHFQIGQEVDGEIL
jgi:hypothetical protein